jgi:hypothetical protein
MVWLDICDEQGNSVYFDIHHVERRRIGRRWRHAVHGVCGNGLFEIEVLVEPGDRSEVTFVDLSAGAAAGLQLLGGIDFPSLETGLIDAAIRRCSSGNAPDPGRPRFYNHSAQSTAPCVNEPGTIWQAIV